MATTTVSTDTVSADAVFAQAQQFKELQKQAGAVTSGQVNASAKYIKFEIDGDSVDAKAAKDKDVNGDGLWTVPELQALEGTDWGRDPKNKAKIEKAIHSNQV